MKNIKIKYILNYLIIISIFILALSSCTDDSNTLINNGALPVVETVSKSEPGPLVPVTIGYPANMYIIQGSGFATLKKIYFNEVDTYFNPTLVTDNAIFVTISLDTPYLDSTSELKIVTANGTFIYPFTIAPPAPILKRGFNSVNPMEGDIITIYGDFFLNPEVMIGTTQVPIISSTITEIKVAVPANSENKYVSVTTISGTVVSKDAIGSALYDDILQGDAGHWMWSGTDNFDTNFGGEKMQGEKSIKFDFGGWNGADMKFVTRDVTKYKAFKVYVKSIGTNQDASIKFVFGGWAFQIIKKINTDWTYIEIPFSEIGNPTTFSELTLQESGNFGGNTILFDDMGFVLK